MSSQLRKLNNAAKKHETGPPNETRLIISAREAGATWPEVAEASGLSRMGVIRIYKTRDVS